MKEAGKKALTLKTLNKSNVWDLQENDIFRLLEAGEKDADLSDNIKHYLDIIRSAFEIEEVKIDRPEVISKYEARGLKVGSVKLDEKNRNKKENHNACDRPHIRKHTPHLGKQTPGSDRKKLRRRMGVAIAEHPGHHTERIRHQHHDFAEGQTTQKGRNV